MSFYDYVINMNKKDLIDEVGRLYEKFKGTSNFVPNLGYNGCIWLAGAFLLYKYLEENKKPGTYALATSVILPAFNGTPAILFVNLMSSMLMSTGTISDWGKVHPYLEETKEIYDGINKYEFSSGRTTKADNQFDIMQQLLNGGMSDNDINNFIMYCKRQGLFVPTH